MKRLLACLALCGILLQACDRGTPSISTPPVELDVFAAASLTESFQDIAKQFALANPGITVRLNFAGSQDLRAQLENGAQADLFASANEKEMNTAATEGLVNQPTIHDFARNRLIIIYPKSNPANLAILADLGRPGIKIDVADASVPVGKYTLQMLDATSKDSACSPAFERQFLANVVSREENVKSVLTKIRLGEADAGVVYATDVTPDAAQDVGTIEVPDAFNQIAHYPIAVTAKSPHPDAARKFEDFVLSDQGQQILRGYHFITN